MGIMAKQNDLVTVKLLDQRFSEHDESLKTFVKSFVREELHKLDEKLDKIIGMFKKFDEEQSLQAEKLSDHEDRIEVVEEKVGIASQ